MSMKFFCVRIGNYNRTVQNQTPVGSFLFFYVGPWQISVTVTAHRTIMIIMLLMK